MKPVISPKELAAAIGVSESSLKRWVDNGVVPASKTAGGHRRIAIADAIRFIRETKAPIIEPDALGLNELPRPEATPPVTTDASEQFYLHLRDGRACEARGLLVSLYLSGQSISDLADGPIRSAMKRLGELWRHDSAGVFIEHRATEICVQAVNQLRSVIDVPPTGVTALGGALTGDPYLLPSLLVATALAAEGVNAVNLGANTPIDAIAEAARRQSPRIIWLSVTTAAAAESLQHGFDHLLERLGPDMPAMVIGGAAIESVRFPDRAEIRIGRSISDLIHVVKHMLGTGIPSP